MMSKLSRGSFVEKIRARAYMLEFGLHVYIYVRCPCVFEGYINWAYYMIFLKTGNLVRMITCFESYRVVNLVKLLNTCSYATEIVSADFLET